MPNNKKFNRTRKVVSKSKKLRGGSRKVNRTRKVAPRNKKVGRSRKVAGRSRKVGGGKRQPGTSSQKQKSSGKGFGNFFRFRKKSSAEKAGQIQIVKGDKVRQKAEALKEKMMEGNNIGKAPQKKNSHLI